jgi:Peptidase family S41
MKKYIIILLLFFAQGVKAQDCTCATNFKYMVEKVKKNYVGYNDKVTVVNEKKFDLFTDSLLLVAKKSDQYECSSILREWLGFFKDKHMIAGIDATGFPEDSIRKFYENDKKVSWTEADLSHYLSVNKDKVDDIEGIWLSDTGTYRIGIVRSNDKKEHSFVGFIIKADSIYWMPGQIKFEIVKTEKGYQTKNFRSKDHSYMHPGLLKNGDTLSFGTYGRWYKNQKNKSGQTTATKKNTDPAPRFTVLDDKTSMFSLASFASLDYIKIMDTLIKKNETILKNTKHLIIDLRNNAGGSVLVYEKLMPYLYTNPILKEGGMVLATDDNITYGYSNKHTELSDSLQQYFKERLAKLKAHKGELYPIYPVDTIKYPATLKYPERVSFLINRNTGSAAELFLLEARQSTKVKLYGENSAGAIDYTEFIKMKMPCDFFVLYYPACKSLRLPLYPLDNIGIKPDIEIPAATTDWIDYVSKH